MASRWSETEGSDYRGSGESEEDGDGGGREVRGSVEGWRTERQ